MLRGFGYGSRRAVVRRGCFHGRLSPGEGSVWDVFDLAFTGPGPQAKKVICNASALSIRTNT